MGNLHHTIIIGGTRGIGRSLACMLAKQGSIVSVIGRRRVSGQELGNSAIHTYPVEITDNASISTTLQNIYEKSGAWTSLVFFQRYRNTQDNEKHHIDQREWQVSIQSTENIIEQAITFIHEKQKTFRSVSVL